MCVFYMCYLTLALCLACQYELAAKVVKTVSQRVLSSATQEQRINLRLLLAQSLYSQATQWKKVCVM